MKVKLLLHLRALLFFQIILFTASAQNRTVTGTVISKATGQPLAGATVLIKGTRTATTTDNSGNFTINVPKQNGLLAISYIGMAPRSSSFRLPVLFRSNWNKRSHPGWTK